LLQHCVWDSYFIEIRQVPRVPLPTNKVGSIASSAMSEGVTPPSLLIRTHASGQFSLADFGLPYTASLTVYGQLLLRAGLSRCYLCESFAGCLDPYPDGLLRCITRFFPKQHRPSLLRERSASHNFRTTISVRLNFRDCSHSFMFRPPGLLDTQIVPTVAYFRAPGSHAFYFRAPYKLLPSCMSGILAVRIGQLTAGDFHPIRFAALSAAPAKT
jgi:hypothetical protein